MNHETLDLAAYTEIPEGAESLALWGERPPNVEINHEKPEHRAILFMKLSGCSNREVALRMGYKDAWISQVTRQPWFRKRLLEEMQKQGLAGFEDLLKGEAVNSLDTLISLRDSATSEQVRATCARDILDRVLGKAIQRVETKVEFTDKVEEIEKLDQEIRELEGSLVDREPEGRAHINSRESGGNGDGN